jgi:hypothetical protein
VVDNTPQVENRIVRSGSLFLRFLMDDIDRIARPITPYSGSIKSQGGKSLTGGGHLRDDIQKQVLGSSGKMVWKKVYARSQEAGRVGRTGAPVRHYTTPGTGKAYAEKSVKLGVVRAEGSMRKAGLI